MSLRAALLLCTLLLSVAAASSSSMLDYSGFFNYNVDEEGMPLSYYVPVNYFPDIPANERPATYNEPVLSIACGNVMVSAADMNAYEFQTEQLLSSVGLNIYDGSVWTLAQNILGNGEVASSYEAETLLAGRTFQFPSIKGDAACVGRLEPYGECTDPFEVGNCGFCYGSDLQSLQSQNAYFFRMISDYYCLEGTVDARCPDEGIPWCWNDYRPVTGEQSWATLLAPLQNAYMAAGGDVNNIDDSSTAIQLAMNTLVAFQAMQIPSVGALYYAPYNTYDVYNDNVGATVSTENNLSALSGLRFLYYIINEKTSSVYKDQLPAIQNLIQGIEKYLKNSYDPSSVYFRQGGTYNYTTDTFDWGAGDEPLFAVDCQTWLISVVGVETIDSWFGAGTALRVWNTTKQLGGYNYNPTTNLAEGVGFTNNAVDNVFSGEWTLGAVNAVRTLAASPSYSWAADDLTSEAEYMRSAVIDQLLTQVTYQEGTANAILYANERYFIPFGWWANEIPSMASTGWMVMVDNNFNPFVLGGSYTPTPVSSSSAYSS